ncbi:hypothetical protein E2C01_033013 [Portunus trituberculatus]|uniref:Uncharacterized protein n=1 Tax=Portunus trituberculatus TaxID=210409 RepID=A0A5B7F299_PORTR|nr:hypothetical protein [Portunus trituberculatus]
MASVPRLINTHTLRSSPTSPLISHALLSVSKLSSAIHPPSPFQYSYPRAITVCRPLYPSPPTPHLHQPPLPLNLSSPTLLQSLFSHAASRPSHSSSPHFP